MSQDPLFDDEQFRMSDTALARLQAMRQALDELRRRNKALVLELRADRIQLTETAIVRTRLETLITFVLGTAAVAEQLEFELAFESKIAELLGRAAEEARRKRLLAPVPQLPDDPMQPAAGLFIPGQ